MRVLAWLLGLEDAASIHNVDVSLAAPWVQGPGLFWLFLMLVAACAAVLLTYAFWQPKGPAWVRGFLAFGRMIVLGMLLVTLADPVLRVTQTRVEKPLLYVLFDGSESMQIQDDFPAAQRRALATAVGLEERRNTPLRTPPGAGQTSPVPTRLEYVQSLLRRHEDNLLARLEREKGCRIEAFIFDGNSTSRLRRLEPGEDARTDSVAIAEQLTAHGQVTALGAALHDVRQQFAAGRLAGVVLVSDFANNSGDAPVGGVEGDAPSPAARLQVPVYAIGVGAAEAIDLSVDMQTDPRMKRTERTSVAVKVSQTGLTDREVRVRVLARPLAGQQGGGVAMIGEQTARLAGPVEIIEFPFTPEDAGRFEFTAEVDPLDGEAVAENNRASREVNIIDDYLRLMYAAHEPTWEWRFIKEVFHRDKLVGLDGFRTFLGSSDPRVRESNVLFLPTLTPRRSEFFAQDVIFLDDMPQAALSPRFCEMLKEFVGQFGGGLVIVSGPRFGPAELAGTPLVELLPVIPDPAASLRDGESFRPRLTPHAQRYLFMQLGSSEAEHRRAWDNLGELPWYQPVAQLHEHATALLEHPIDVCRDGKTPQPIVAVRQYGAGEVVYVAHNESWRLRKRFGEKYYRQFWSQLIYRLGMSHALGEEKRFVARTDRPVYRAEENAVLTVEAYDENFEPLTEDKLPNAKLVAEVTLPAPPGGTPQTRLVDLPMLRPGMFEAAWSVFTPGEYGVRVKDPVADRYREARFMVTSLSAERRQAVRNVRLQEEIAAQTGGKAYDLTTVHSLPDDLQLKPITETSIRNRALWSTPLWFMVIAVLLIAEWSLRKWIHLK